MGHEVDAEFFARLAELNNQFAAALPQTLGRLLAARNAFDANKPPKELIEQFHATLHTLAGSAATFGFRVLGQQARSLEQRLRVLLAFETIAAPEWEAWLSELDCFVAWGMRDPKSSYPNDETVV